MEDFLALFVPKWCQRPIKRIAGRVDQKDFLARVPDQVLLRVAEELVNIRLRDAVLVTPVVLVNQLPLGVTDNTPVRAR